MDNYFLDFRLQELKSLEDEVSFLIRDTRNLELYALGGMVAYYGWLQRIPVILKHSLHA
jgi:hypothetical protein